MNNLVDGQCEMTVGIDEGIDRDTCAFSVIWHNAFVANKVCGGQGKSSAVVNIGENQLEWPLLQHVDIILQVNTEKFRYAFGGAKKRQQYRDDFVRTVWADATGINNSCIKLTVRVRNEG